MTTRPCPLRHPKFQTDSRAEIALAVTRDGDRIFVRENDAPKQELGAESERDFFSETSDDEYSFEFDKQGRASMMILHADGKDIRITRVENATANGHVK